MPQLGNKVNPPVEDQTDTFILNGGLDLTSPKLLAEKGSLLDCSNREVIDRVGYKRIDGFVRYDGRVDGRQTELYYISANSYSGTLSTDFANQYLIVEGEATTVFGKVVGTATIATKPSLIYVRINEDAEPVSGDVVDKFGSGNAAFTVTVEPTPYWELSGLDAEEYIEYLQPVNDTLSGTVGTLPENPIGLHWFRDKLYAVVTDETMYFELGGTTEVKTGYYLIGQTSGAVGQVLYVDLVSGTWAGANASGMIQFKYLSSPNTPFQDAEFVDLYASASATSVTDSSFSSTRIVLNFQGNLTDQAASSPGTWSAQGDAATTTSQAPTGATYSLELDGSGDAINRNAELELAIGTSWTLEAWFRSSNGGYSTPGPFQGVFARVNTGGTNYIEDVGFYDVGLNYRAVFGGRDNKQAQITAASTIIASNTWYFLQIINNHGANTCTMYLGQQGGSLTSIGSTTSMGLRIQDIGMSNTSSTPSNEFEGFIGPFRVTAVARSAGFPPEGDFPVPVDANVLAVRTREAGDPDPYFASIWKSQTEQQSIDHEGDLSEVGWTAVDMGYEVDFDAGSSGFGTLVQIEKGVDPIFTPSSSSTSVTGTSGTALTAYQAVGVAGEPSQVLGWVLSGAETSFPDSADMVTALATDDTNYLYADAMAYWDRNTAARTFQPSGGVGATDNTSLFANAAGSQAFTITGVPSLSTYLFSTNGYAYFAISNFKDMIANLPEEAIIQGIEVNVEYLAWVLNKAFSSGAVGSENENFAVFDSVRLEATLLDHDVTTNTATKLGSPKEETLDYDPNNFTLTAADTVGRQWIKDAESTATFGGSGDIWGMTTISRSTIISDRFALGFRMRVDCGRPDLETAVASADQNTAYRLLVDKIDVKIHYSVGSVRYYFTDNAGTPTAILSGDVTDVRVATGSFSAGNATGTLQLVNLEVVSGTVPTILNNYTIHTANPPSAGNQVGVVNEPTSGFQYMTYNGLPSLDRILDDTSRYEFTTQNFYGQEQFDAVYGVSGADRAFCLSTFLNDDSSQQEYVVKITTNTEDTTNDKPRHVAYHHGALALALKDGIVRLSVPNEPENFSGVDGAVEVGLGDRITGLLSMHGTMLGVFCENSIWGIAGTDADNYQTQVLAPYTGAIEYTVVDMGIPVYCDSRGISTLSQSEKYGSFLGERLSQKVTPWILPRMLRNTAQFSGKGVVCAIPVRTKNQYRLFFKDGKCLVMTMNPNTGPSFTFSDYVIGNDPTDTDAFLSPIAYSSQIDDKGEERIHFAHYSPKSTVIAPDTLRVYEMDKGWGFDGVYIPASYTINWYYRDPFSYQTIRKFRVDGLTNGISSCKIYCAKDYDTTYSTAGADISLPRTFSTQYQEEQIPASNIANIAESGRSISLKIVDEPYETDTEILLPPDIHQVGLVQFAPGGRQDA